MDVNAQPTLKVALLQTAPTLHDEAGNIAAAERLIEAHPGAALYVLPEMWATGFDMREPKSALRAREWMRRVAHRLETAIAGSLPMEENGRLYNRFYFVTPEAEFSYDKWHLFAYSGETRHFQAGHQRVVVAYRGFRILLATCYDLRFPVFLRCRDDYDLILHVACWPYLRQTAYTALLTARAIENLCYVVSVNRTGREGFTRYAGGSCALAPDGTSLCQLGAEPATATVDLSLSKLQSFRHRFPFLHDADAFHFSNTLN